MLTKRTNLLFDEHLWQFLSKQAKKEKTSVAHLVRQAVRIAYQTKIQLKKRQTAIDRILSIRPKPVKGTINYKALIDEGRKQ